MDGIVIASPPRLTDIAAVRVTPDGSAVVIPHILPLTVPAEVMGMTVAEWLGLDTPVIDRLAEPAHHVQR
ncbi:hypothetical protein [Sphaerimonospora thailandensis]|uniref:Uncharacterized protein n=1 Tax=Sphaerimonospora thailandensis TaxID=795644 RepID=A0A8J3VZR3_9ACTN|nr:hypothetical protein [Sphaerimonospora thailandensis]GIH70323.1 hypothetical protein Mth01_25760 [Sphaerimonospora thailandensis]